MYRDVVVSLIQLLCWQVLSLFYWNDWSLYTCILSPTKCDEFSNQFSKFLEQDLKKYHLEFEKFDQKCDQLDDFYFHMIQIQQCESLSYILRLIFTLLHGQAAVEWCFNISDNVLTQNVNTDELEMETDTCRQTERKKKEWKWSSKIDYFRWYGEIEIWKCSN